MSNLKKDQQKIEQDHLERVKKRVIEEAEMELVKYQYKTVPMIKIGLIIFHLLFFLIIAASLFFMFEGFMGERHMREMHWFAYLVLGSYIMFSVYTYHLVGKQLTTPKRLESMKKEVIKMKLKENGVGES